MKTVNDIRIDVGLIPEETKRMMVASLLKAFRDWKRAAGNGSADPGEGRRGAGTKDAETA